MDLYRKIELEASLDKEKKLIEDGRLKDENPLDISETFSALCEACRRGDLQTCQEIVVNGVNINARDRFDYTPLILASLCGHYEVVQYLLESGALCKRDTFQGERCLYNALNDRIRRLLLSYDYHKSADPLQPFAAHITSLLSREVPKTSDFVLIVGNESFHVHKFILRARCPFWAERILNHSPDIESWECPVKVPSQAASIAIRHIYLDEIPNDAGCGPGTGFSQSEILEGVEKLSWHFDIPRLAQNLLYGDDCSDDAKLAGQWNREEVEKGQDQLHCLFREEVLGQRMFIDTAKVDDVKWDRNNVWFADVLLRADVPEDDVVLGEKPENVAMSENDSQIEGASGMPNPVNVAILGNDSQIEGASGMLNPEGVAMLKNDGQIEGTSSMLNGSSIGQSSNPSRRSSRNRPPKKSVLFPVHRAMLIRSEFFLKMFSSPFREAQPSTHLPIIPVDCKPEVLEIVLTFLYTEKSDFPLEHALDVLFAADLLLIERLKVRAAVVISTLGNGPTQSSNRRLKAGLSEAAEEEDEVINIYDVLRAAWLMRVPRLEEFAARYFAYRLETYIEEEEFAEMIKESATRIQGRQETDSIELLDEIRFYLSERFRLRFEDSGLQHLMAESPPQLPPSTSPPISPSGPSPDSTATIAITRTLDPASNPAGTGDEFAQEAAEYRTLLGRIEALLERVGLDA